MIHCPDKNLSMVGKHFWHSQRQGIRAIQPPPPGKIIALTRMANGVSAIWNSNHQFVVIAQCSTIRVPQVGHVSHHVEAVRFARIYQVNWISWLEITVELQLSRYFVWNR